jgi:integrase
VVVPAHRTLVSAREHRRLMQKSVVVDLLDEEIRHVGARDESARPAAWINQRAIRVRLRPGEARYAEWGEFDLSAAEWRISADKMKMRRPHRIPLSKQALALLYQLRSVTGSGRWLFPSVRSLSRPISENTLNAPLRRLGYGKDDMCAHGFRSLASTRLNEMGRWTPDAIERQLAHVDSNAVRRAYTHGAEYWQERVAMMQAWADYLDTLRADGQVIQIWRAQQGQR